MHVHMQTIGLNIFSSPCIVFEYFFGILQVSVSKGRSLFIAGTVANTIS